MTSTDRSRVVLGGEGAQALLEPRTGFVGRPRPRRRRAWSDRGQAPRGRRRVRPRCAQASGRTPRPAGTAATRSSRRRRATTGRSVRLLAVVSSYDWRSMSAVCPALARAQHLAWPGGRSTSASGPACSRSSGCRCSAGSSKQELSRRFSGDRAGGPTPDDAPGRRRRDPAARPTHGRRGRHPGPARAPGRHARRRPRRLLGELAGPRPAARRWCPPGVAAVAAPDGGPPAAGGSGGGPTGRRSRLDRAGRRRSTAPTSSCRRPGGPPGSSPSTTSPPCASPSCAPPTSLAVPRPVRRALGRRRPGPRRLGFVADEVARRVRRAPPSGSSSSTTASTRSPAAPAGAGRRAGRAASATCSPLGTARAPQGPARPGRGPSTRLAADDPDARPGRWPGPTAGAPTPSTPAVAAARHRDRIARTGWVDDAGPGRPAAGGRRARLPVAATRASACRRSRR